MDCEAEEKAAVYSDDDEVGFDDDPFLAEGLSSDSESSDAGDVAATHGSGRTAGLHTAKSHCEGLKRKVFQAKMKRA